MRIDLKKHRIVGLLMGFALVLSSLLAGVDETLSGTPEVRVGAVAVLVVAAWVWAALVGWAKERLWDARGKGTYDAADAQWTAQGGLEGAVLAVLVFYIVEYILGVL